MLSAILLASLLAGPHPAGPPLKYKFETKSTTTVDLSAMGQGNQTVETSAVAFFAVTISDTTGGQLAHVVIDSLHFDGGAMMAMLPDSLLQLKPGTYFHVYLVDGKVRNGMTPSSTSLVAAQAVPGIQLLFPGLKLDRPVGSTWVDTVVIDSTVKVETSAAEVHMGSKTYTAWTMTARDGDKLTFDATSKGTTTMNLMGNDMQGNTTGKSHLVLSSLGMIREGTGETKTDMAMELGGSTAQLTVVVTGTLTRLP